jgi:uncharacterized tellurite resistance protein B-like protein
MQTIDKLRNLLVMAAYDGSLTENEIKYLTDRCRGWGISDAEFAEAIEYALSADAELAIPHRKQERLAMMADMIGVMAADGELADREMDMFAVLAAKMQITEKEINTIIDTLTKPKQQRGSA